MENRSEHIPPEQGWGAYATPPAYPSHKAYQSQEPLRAEAELDGETTLPPQTSLCARVREKLQPLFEEDETIRPEMATAIYGHLAVCPGCSAEYEQIRYMDQKLVALLEALPPMDLPMDYSRLIMQQIQADRGAVSGAAGAFPTLAASSANFGEVATGAESEVTISRRALSEQTQAKQTLGTTQQSALQTGARLWQRMIMAAIVSAIAFFCMATSWGRQMLGANLETMRVWIGQVGDMLNRVPLMGQLANNVFAALSGVSEALETSFRELGALAGRGLAIDVALFAAACFFLAAQRQRSSIRGI